MRILALTKERNQQWPKKIEVNYHDISCSTTEALQDKPDLIWHREFNTGEDYYNGVLDMYPDVPKAIWWIDTHVAQPQMIEYVKRFDYVFVAHSPYLEQVKKIVGHDKVYWLPLCFPYRTDSVRLNYE